MKAIFKTLFLLFSVGLVMFIHSCQKLDNILSADSISELKVDFAFLNEISDTKSIESMSDELHFLSSSHVLLHNSQIDDKGDKNSEIESVLMKTTVVNYKNFNEAFSIIDNRLEVLAVTLLKDDNHIIDGLILHILDNKGIMKLEAFKKTGTSNNFKRVELPANQVSTLVFENILFVARCLFSKRDIITLGSSNLPKAITNNSYDDLSLLKFGFSNNLLKHKLTLNGVDFLPQNTRALESLKIPDPEPCAIAVHHCQNGSETRINCQPFQGGFKGMPDCARDEVYARLITDQMEDEIQIFEDNLVEDSLYSFKDWLYQYPESRIYHDAYYNLSPHFNSTLDFELLSAIVSASLDMRDFVNAFLSDDQNYVLGEQAFNKFINIIQMSSDKSQSTVYQNVIEGLIEEVEVYKAKNIQQIKSLLSE